MFIFSVFPIGMGNLATGVPSAFSGDGVRVAARESPDETASGGGK
jgi:hypothetical protein